MNLPPRPSIQIDVRYRLISVFWPAVFAVPHWQIRLGCLALLATVTAATPEGSPEPPLPSVEFILQQVVAHTAKEHENDAQFLAHYHFVKWKEQAERDPQGRLTKATFKTSTNNPTPPLAEPMLPDQGNAPVVSSGLHLAAGGHARGRAIEKREFEFNDELLQRFDFTGMGREIFGTRSTFVLEFAPKPGPLPTRQLKDRFINHLAGRLWIDESSWLIAKVEVHLTAPVEVVGGLVGAIKQLTYRFEREITPEGWWYTRLVDWELIGRAFVNRKELVYHEGRTNIVRVW